MAKLLAGFLLHGVTFPNIGLTYRVLGRYILKNSVSLEVTVDTVNPGYYELNETR